MRCSQAQQWISRRADGVLDERLAARLADHLEDCEACRAYADALAALGLDLFEVPEPTQDFVARVARQTGEMQVRRRSVLRRPAVFRPVAAGLGVAAAVGGFAIGSLLSAFAVSTTMLMLVRLFLGMAVGIASFTAPLYLSEMAPSQTRGGLISMYQLMITIGILFAYISDTLLSYGGHWRFMLGILVIPSSLMFLGILFLPNSPRWLILVGQKNDAIAALKKLRHEDEIEEEVKEIEKTVQAKQKGFELLIRNKYFRKAVLLGIGLQAIQQFTGMNVIMYYAPKIFKMAGFASTAQAMFGTVLVGLINVLATFIAIAFVDRIGRKPILLIGFIVMGLSMGTLGLMFHVGMTTDALLQFIAVGALLIFIIGFAMSAGPIIWVICSEIYPLSARDIGVTASTASNWQTAGTTGSTGPIWDTRARERTRPTATPSSLTGTPASSSRSGCALSGRLISARRR